jgi:hypothetical protein
VVPSIKLTTVGSRGFPVAGPQVWNDLPEEVKSAQSLSIFRQRFKTFMFQLSFPTLHDRCMTAVFSLTFSVDLTAAFYLGRFKNM